MLKNKLIPKFLSDADAYLLLKYPLVWSSKIHYVAWFTLLSWAFLAVVGLIVPESEIEYSFLGFYWLMISLCLIAGIIIWFVFLFRHNSTKQYGNRTEGREWVNLGCNYFCLLLISSVLFVLPAVSVLKSHLNIQEKGLVKQINTLNVNSAFFPMAEYSLDVLYNPMDTNRLYITGYKLQSGNTYGSNEYKMLDKNYLGYDEISNAFSKIKGKQNIEKAVVEYLAIGKSYGVQHFYTADKIVAMIDDTLGYKRDENFEICNANFNRSLEEKVNPAFNSIERFDFLFYGMFYYVWLLIFIPIALVFILIFRNTSAKFFLISTGVTILLVIVNALIIGIVLNNHDDNQTGDYMFLMVFFGAWTIALLIMSANVFSQKSYKGLNAYAVFLFNLLLPLLPWIFTGLVFSYQRYTYFSSADYYSVDYSNFRSAREFWEKWMFPAGLVLLVIMQQVYFKKLYERLWALPK